MAVVQRMQRVYPFPPEPALGQSRPLYAPKAAGVIGAPASRVLALVAADVVGFAAACGVAALATPAPAASAVPGLALGLAGLAGMLAYFSTHDHYEHRLTFWPECRGVLRATALVFMVMVAAAFVLGAPLPRLPMLATALLFPPAALGLRGVARAALRRAGLWQVRVVLVGDGTWGHQAEAALRARPGLGYDVVGQASAALLGAAGTQPGAWAGLLRHHDAGMLVLAHDTEAHLPATLVAALVRERVPYAVLPRLSGFPVAGTRRTALGHEAVLVSYRNNLRKPVARAAKIAFDLLAASAALVVLAPFMLIIAAIVGLDGGPVFYAHTRIGARGRVFRCLKFRSMVADSEAALQALFARDPAAAEEWARAHKLRRDPRVTWIGRVLRKTSLDELPQLFNVLRMEMSLVGPRPIVSLEIPKYAEDIAYYYETRPGITGLWQVSGRSDTTYAQRVRLDSWYVKNWSIWQDFAILLRTIPAVASGRGAG